MATASQLLFGNNSLHNKIKRQNELLRADRHRVEQCTEALRESAVHAVTSPMGLGIAAASGFALARVLQRPHKKVLPAEAEQEKTAGHVLSHAWLWEILLPVAITYIRDFATAHLAPKTDKGE